MSEVSVRSLISGAGYAQRSISPRRATEAEPEDEYRAFSFGRVGKRSLSMLSFRKRDGSVEVFCYADLRRISSPDPSRQLILRFVDTVVVIKGEKLQDLLNYIKAWRCDEIVESRGIMGLEIDTEQTVVEEIHYKQG